MPKLVIVQQKDGDWSHCRFVYDCYYTNYSFEQSSGSIVNCSWVSKGVSWYSNKSVSYQLNAGGKTYNYVAVG